MPDEIKIEDLQKTINDQAALIQSQGDSLKTMQEQIEGIPDMLKQFENMKLQLKTQETIIGADKVEKLPKIPEDLVKHEKKKYKWALPVFTFEGQRYTAEEAATDKELIARIMQVEGQGLLKEQA